MGAYINIGNAGFQSARNGEYVDKSGLIAVVNATLNTRNRFSCVSRCRRFGKSMAAEMLCAYYDQSCDSRALFADLEIAKDPSFEQHLNKYPAIYLDLTSFVTRFHDEDIVGHINAELIEDISSAFPQVETHDGDDLMKYLIRINAETNQPFIFIIDEWDAICREFKPGTQAMDGYVNWLRRMFKEVNASKVFAAVYMTGILPIKKYKTESALNNFTEYSMVDPGDMAPFFGFTKAEVRALAYKHGFDFDELEKWYDGYQIGSECSMFNPNSVVQALRKKWCSNYWAATGAYEAVARGIDVAHDEHTSILSYNDENSLACVLSIAYYYAKNDYIMHRELPSGKGFADIVLIPRKNIDSPAIVIELKYNQDADAAISQIRRKQYPAKIAEYTDNLLLVGINYDKQLKTHQCRIEHFVD